MCYPSHCSAKKSEIESLRLKLECAGAQEVIPFLPNLDPERSP